MDCSPPGSSVHGILQKRILEWVAIPSSRGSSWPRGWTHVLMSSALAGGFFTTSTTWEIAAMQVLISVLNHSFYLAWYSRHLCTCMFRHTCKHKTKTHVASVQNFWAYFCFVEPMLLKLSCFVHNTSWFNVKPFIGTSGNEEEARMH